MYVGMVHDDDRMKELWNLRQQYHSTSVYGLSRRDQDEENEIKKVLEQILTKTKIFDYNNWRDNKNDDSF